MATGYMGSGDMAKGLYAAPEGLPVEEAPPIEIEVEDPESLSIGIGDIEIELRDRKSTRLNSSH